MLRYSYVISRRIVNRSSPIRSLSTPSPTNTAKKPLTGNQQSSGNNDHKSKKQSNFLFNTTIGILFFDLALAAVVYQMNESQDFDQTMKKNAPQAVYDGFLLLRDWGKASGLLGNPSLKKSMEPSKAIGSLLPTIEKPIEVKKPDIEAPKQPVVSSPVIEQEEISPSPSDDEKVAIIEESMASIDAEGDNLVLSQELESQPEESTSIIDDNQPVPSDTKPSLSASASTGVEPVIPVLPSEAIAKTIKVDTADDIIFELTNQFYALKKEFEENLMKDLHDMDEKTLRYKYVQLATEFFERNKWEGVRMHQAMKQMEAEVAVKYLELMRQQRLELESYMQSLLSKKDLELLEHAINQHEEMKQTMKDEVEKINKSYDDAYHHKLDQEVEKQVSLVRQQAEDEYHHQLALGREGMMKKQLESLNHIEELRTKLVAIYRHIDDATIKKAVSIDLHKLSSAILSIEQALLSTQPVGSYVSSVKSSANEDELIIATINSLPESILSSGAPNQIDLKLRFAVARNEVRKAALAPSGVPTFMGQLVGNALAAISWSPKGYVQGEGIEEILARAEFHLEQGRLNDAVHEVNHVPGYAGELLADWKKLATNRLIADQTAKILRAEAALVHHSFP